MSKTVQLWKVEVLPGSKFDKNIFIFMKSAQCIIQSVETFGGMHGILRQVDEIKKCPYGTSQACWLISWKGEIHYKSKNDVTYVLMFLTSKIQKHGDPFVKMPSIVIWR